MSIADLIVGNRLIRSAADAFLVRMARRRTASLDALDAGAVQEQTLLQLVRKASQTRFGIEHNFDKIGSIVDYQQRVPLRDYESFWETYWKRDYPRIENITWPGKIPYFGLSSGTTSGATKYIPISREMLASNKRAGLTTVSLFRSMYPESKLFNGRFFFLGGNTNMIHQADGSRAGDLSAIAAVEVSSWVRPYTFPPLAISSIPDWESKLDAMARAASHLPITAFSGVPAWMLVLFERMRTLTGKATVAEIWPEFRLLVHGGTKFDPYRDVFRKVVGSDRVRFIEVYPCSEGFVATEDPRYDLLRLIPDHDIFFEFIPKDELGTDRPRRHTLRDLEVGIEYAVVMTTCAGLWSYIVGDTVAFEKRDPPLLRFTGRTKYFLSAFGEHLISEEVEKGVAAAAKATGATVHDFHVGPIFPTDPQKPGWHRYLVEFSQTPDSPARFREELDAFLGKINEDYCAHRQGNLSMGPPEIIFVKSKGCETWMLAHGKRPPQHKFPRMDNTGKLTLSIFNWLNENGWVLSSTSIE